MISSTLRLRIIARALIEWRTPTSSLTYREVLGELIAVNPLASSIGITPESQVLRLDDQGAVLWYLSETLGSTDVPKLDEVENWLALLRVRAERTIQDYARAGVSDTELWPKGPMKSQIAAGIVRGINHGKRSGYWALFAVSIKLGIQAQKRYILRLLEDEQITHGFIQKLSHRIQRAYSISRDLQKLTTLLGAAVGIIQVIHSDGILSRWISTPWVIGALSVVAGNFTFTYLLKIGAVTDGYIEVVRSVRRASMEWLRNAKYSTRRRFGIALDGSRRMTGPKRRGYAFGKVYYTLLRGVEEFVRQSMRNHILRVKKKRSLKRTARKRDPEVDLVLYGRMDSLRTEFGEFCGSQLHVLRMVVLMRPSWVEIAFNATRAADSEVIRELLSLVRSPRLDWAQRHRLMAWLFRTQVIDRVNP